MILSRDDILKAEDIATETVSVPEWGGEVLCRGLTGVERDQFESGNLERRGNQLVPNYANVRAKLVVRCVVNEDGSRMFTDQDADDLGAKAGSAIARIHVVASRLSGMTDEEAEKIAEDFGQAPGSSSSSHSPPGSTKRSRNSSGNSPAGN